MFLHLLARLLLKTGIPLAFPARVHCWLMISLLSAKTFSTESLWPISLRGLLKCRILFVLSEFMKFVQGPFLQPV